MVYFDDQLVAWESIVIKQNLRFQRFIFELEPFYNQDPDANLERTVMEIGKQILAMIRDLRLQLHSQLH